MVLQWWFDQAQRAGAKGSAAVAGTPNAWELTVTREEWIQASENIGSGGGRLMALWSSRGHAGENTVRAAFLADAGLLVLSLQMGPSDTCYPGIEQTFPSAG